VERWRNLEISPGAALQRGYPNPWRASRSPAAWAGHHECRTEAAAWSLRRWSSNPQQNKERGKGEVRRW